MKKLYLFIVLLCLFFTACSNSDGPVIPEIDFDIYSSGGLLVNVEKDYNNFSVECDDNQYSKDTETIVFRLKNNNPGNGFYFYNTPIVEKKSLGAWKSVKYDPSSKYIGRYGFCGNENDTTTCFTAEIRLYAPRRSDPSLRSVQNRQVVVRASALSLRGTWKDVSWSQHYLIRRALLGT